MAITRRWQAGFELGDLYQEFTSISGSSSYLYATTAKQKTGSYSMVNISQNNHFGVKAIPATRQIRGGFWFYVSADIGSADYNTIWFRNNAGTELVAIEYRGPIGGSPLIIEVAGVNQDIEPGACPTATWFHIGYDIKIDASAGWVKVYKDGIEVLSFTGNTGNTDIVDLCLGSAIYPNSIVYWDDPYVDDTTGEAVAAIPPILRFYYVTPDEGGNYSDPGGWTGSDGNPTDNFLLVDEVPPNGDTDYIIAASADLLDSYTMTTIVLGSNEVIQALIPTVSSRRAGTTEAIAIGTRYSATDLIGDDLYPTAAYKAVSERQTTKPGGGAWDQTALDAVEVVLKSRGTY